MRGTKLADVKADTGAAGAAAAAAGARVPSASTFVCDIVDRIRSRT